MSQQVPQSVIKSIFRGGLLPINKPTDWTANDVVQKIKGTMLWSLRDALGRPGDKRVQIPIGHGGTLDPFATGVLILGVANFTRSLSYFTSGCTKEYVVTGKLGSSTNTQDRTGTVINEGDFSRITRSDFDNVVSKFNGRIQQIPPMYSAKKVNGKKLYDLALKGKEIERKPIEVEILRSECTSFEPPFFTLKLLVSSGTYIRTIVHDIGEQLGCHAHAFELERTQQGAIHLSDCLNIEDCTLEKIAEVLPMHMKAIDVNFFQDKISDQSNSPSEKPPRRYPRAYPRKY